jgi:hypothetical protein
MDTLSSVWAVLSIFLIQRRRVAGRWFESRFIAFQAASWLVRHLRVELTFQ